MTPATRRNNPGGIGAAGGAWRTLWCRGGYLMARPRVFISSTYYDLRHIRTSLDAFVSGLGFDTILSEKGDIAYTPERPVDESCYREVGTADLFVLIVGGRYGAAASDQDIDDGANFYERYDSITNREHAAAVEQDIPIYVLIDKAVNADYQTFRRNRDNSGINYAHVDSINIFLLIENILLRPRNNPVHTFERFADIEDWLREQWSGLFRELLQTRTRVQEIQTLSGQVAEMKEVSETIKNYMEVVVRGVVPNESDSLIQTEEKRLHDSRILRRLRDNTMVEFLSRRFPLTVAEVAKMIDSASSVEGFLDEVLSSTQGKAPVEGELFDMDPGEFRELSLNSEFVNDFDEARVLLGCTPLASPAQRRRRSAPRGNFLRPTGSEAP